MNKYQQALDKLEYFAVQYENTKTGEQWDEITDEIQTNKKIMQELVDKSTPKKPISKYIVDGRYCVCPECGALLDEECLLKTYECLREVHQYCHVCGQAIDWSEEDGSSD